MSETSYFYQMTPEEVSIQMVRWENVKKYLKKKRITQEMISDHTGIDIATIKSQKRNKKGLSEKLIKGLQSAFGIDPDYFMPPFNEKDEMIEPAPGIKELRNATMLGLTQKLDITAHFLEISTGYTITGDARLGYDFSSDGKKVFHVETLRMMHLSEDLFITSRVLLNGMIRNFDEAIPFLKYE